MLQPSLYYLTSALSGDSVFGKATPKAGSSIYSSELLRTPPGGDMLPMPRLSFYDGTAELTTRNSFLDVDVRSKDADGARRRAHSAPPRVACEEATGDDSDEGKLICHTPSERTVSTEYGDSDVDFERQTTGCPEDLQSLAGLQDAEVSEHQKEDLTSVRTVMIKNIPCRCRTDEILHAVDSVGFAGTYDCFYLPMNRQGMGYAFLNFTELGTAACFKDAISGYRFPGRRSTKRVEVAPAELQGREQMMQFLSQTQVSLHVFGP
ncbi:ML5 [Symbiodinium natans]|uniref:ML5 protein n=1 Tax=Symbiodinium natans TaxID=878477 RepID=A0A812QRR0_9DINO|nr:ML5 [Symbiodinium natans]